MIADARASIRTEDPVCGFWNPVWAIHRWCKNIGLDTDDDSFRIQAAKWFWEERAVSLLTNTDVDKLCRELGVDLKILPSGRVCIRSIEQTYIGMTSTEWAGPKESVNDKLD